MSDVSFDVTPSMMVSIAEEIKKKMEEWDASVKQIYQLQAELDAMWEGEAVEAFNKLFAEDQVKFQRLSAMMEEYQSTIITIANDFINTEKIVKATVEGR